MLTVAVLVAVSAPGLWLARWLLRPLRPYATAASVFDELFRVEEEPGVCFGFDSTGLVD